MVFVDGSNWYHSLRAAKVPDLGRLSYKRIFDRLCAPEADWTQAYYYTAEIGVLNDPAALRAQRDFLTRLQAEDRRIQVVLGRLESRWVEDRGSEALLRYLAELRVRIDPGVFRDLVSIGRAQRQVRVFIEKAVDVQIAVDMVRLAYEWSFDRAYLLSADGDFTPAVEVVQACGATVHSVSASPGHRLEGVVDSHTRVDRLWFSGCYR